MLICTPTIKLTYRSICGLITKFQVLRNPAMTVHPPAHPAVLPWSRLLYVTCATVLLAFHPVAVWAQAAAGQVMVVTGAVRVVNAQGQERALEKGAEVRSGDKIVTGQGALAQVRMNDGGYLSIRSETEMSIDNFVHNEQESSKSSFVVSLIKGGFRSITGLIGRANPDAYRVKASTATIGIRGTDHEPMLILPSATNVPTANPPGVYDKVNSGETYIQNERGILSLKPGQIGFTPLKPDVSPQVVIKVPDFYRVNVKTDARDPKDAQNDRSDDRTRTPGAATSLRPSTADRQGNNPLRAGAEVPALRPTTGLTPLQPLAPTGNLGSLPPPPTMVQSPTMIQSPTLIQSPTMIQSPTLIQPTLTSPTLLPPPPILQAPLIQTAPTLISPTTTTTILR
jgi:hypothetical protein